LKKKKKKKKKKRGSQNEVWRCCEIPEEGVPCNTAQKRRLRVGRVVLSLILMMMGTVGGLVALGMLQIVAWYVIVVVVVARIV